MSNDRVQVLTEQITVTVTSPVGGQTQLTLASPAEIQVTAAERGPAGADGGGGDMYKAIYDTTLIEADCFDLGNHYGNLDGGTFN